jgi:prevent-host-death family protein
MTRWEVNVLEAEDRVTVSASAFKAKCLELLNRLDTGALERVTVTKRGKPIAVVERARTPRKPYKSAYGFLRGYIKLSPDYDPFEQVIEDPDDPFIGKTRRAGRRRVSSA